MIYKLLFLIQWTLQIHFYQIHIRCFFVNGMHNDHTAFELFYRKAPFGGNYVVFAGLKDVHDFLNSFKFTEEHIEYVKQFIIPPGANEQFWDYLRNLDCSQVKIRSLREGSLCYPKEPLISLEGPQGICQLIETPLINLVSFPSLVATNASRMRQIVGNDRKLVEFGLRRAQGPNGAFSATQYSYLGGFDGSSNMIAGMKLGIPITGTIAHSYVTSFNSLDEVKESDFKQKAIHYWQEMKVKTNQGELASFITYAQSLPTNFLCLIDTYNTLKSGIFNFLAVAFALIDQGHQPRGIRLDSGDLAKLSKEVREIFQHYGKQFNKDVSYFKIVASNDINEESLLSFVKEGHEIDVFGIGTNLVTCQKQPALGLVYKLIEIKGQPAMKLSEEPSKTTWPNQKRIFRVHSSDGNLYDIVSSINVNLELIQDFLIVDPDNGVETKIQIIQIEEILLHQNQIHSLLEAKQYCAQQLHIYGQKKIYVRMTKEFYEAFQKKLSEIQ
ncbi:hypothetical protein pb186bvf_019687 [Paramecium bursaria]